MKRIVITAVVIAGLGLSGWQVVHRISLTGSGASARREKPSVAVETVAVTRGSIRDIGRFTGSLSPWSRFIVAPKIGGRLEKMAVNIGDPVTENQLVALVDDKEYQQQVMQAAAELEVARANVEERRTTLENARREYERTVVLRKKKIASESQLDAAESEYRTQQAKLKVAMAQVSQKNAELGMARVRLSYAEIRVPPNHTSGYRVVGERFMDEGAMLAPNTPIASILDIGSVLCVIHVIERDYSRIEPGQAARIQTDAFPGRTFQGRVVRIAPLLKETSREARVEIEVPNGKKLLKPGMFVRVQIEFARHRDAVLVPVNALVKRDGRQGIFLADATEKKARFVPVEAGIVNEGMVEILTPLPLDRVITLGQHLLEDGVGIMPTEASVSGNGPDRGKTS